MPCGYEMGGQIQGFDEVRESVFSTVDVESHAAEQSKKKQFASSLII